MAKCQKEKKAAKRAANENKRISTKNCRKSKTQLAKSTNWEKQEKRQQSEK